jgi:hypothetical protein
MTKPIWITPVGFLSTASELVSTSTAVSATGTGVTYSIISGSLPGGLLLSNTGTIYGTPSAVVNTVRNKFVVRATNTDGVVDRTFLLDVQGADKPIWSTAGGYLPAGYNGEGYILNYGWVDINLAATAVDPSSTPLRYYVAENSGSIPPGLTLSQDGRLSGYVNYTFVAQDVPVLHTFIVTATDGVAETTSSQFNLLVLGPDMLRADSDFLTLNDNEYSILDLTILPTSISYLQPLQFLNGTDLGVVRADNNQDIPVKAYDPAPFRGPVTYSIIEGIETQVEVVTTTTTTIETVYIDSPAWSLPDGLSLDPDSGYLYGFIPYQPAYTQNYNLRILATKTDQLSGTVVTATNTFTLAIKGEVESAIEWITDSNLGSIYTGIDSDLYVKARQLVSGYTIKYDVVSGDLPPGLDLARDGTLCGQVNYGSTGTYTFTVSAGDVYGLSSIQREFSVTAVQITSTEYTKIYMKPFFTMDKRQTWSEFISNTFTFDPSLIYRYYDSNFGVQHELRVNLEFGIERLDLEYYVGALRENFYRRRFNFGAVKKAVAQDVSGNNIYEIIYLDVVEDNVDALGQSAVPTFYANNDIYYPSSIDNMRRQLRLIPLEDNTYIKTRVDNQPRFMSTPQDDDYKPVGYMRVIPLCYALPGQGDKIISRIKLSNFNFGLLDFEVDRIIVENSADNNSAKYLIFDRQSLSDAIETDDQLFGLDWAETPELTVRLDDENDSPINRK